MTAVRGAREAEDGVLPFQAASGASESTGLRLISGPILRRSGSGRPTPGRGRSREPPGSGPESVEDGITVLSDSGGRVGALSPGESDDAMANDKHVRILAQGVQSWNQWRGEHAEVQPDLSGLYLNGAMLMGANLAKVNMANANLSDADLDCAILSGADLSGTDLRGANLLLADLSEATLDHANLNGADLSGASLSAASLIGALLRGSDLTRASLRGANLTNADVSGADLTEAKLEGAVLVGIKGLPG